MNNLIEDICFLNPQPEEIVILYYKDDAPVDQLRDVYNMLVDKLPNNKVIALNRSLCLSIVEKDSLIKFLKG